jgi:hypothetical protein
VQESEFHRFSSNLRALLGKCGSPHLGARLGRLMCGRPAAFRVTPLLIFTLARLSLAKVRFEIESRRKGRAFPHIGAAERESVIEREAHWKPATCLYGQLPSLTVGLLTLCVFCDKSLGHEKSIRDFVDFNSDSFLLGNTGQRPIDHAIAADQICAN